MANQNALHDDNKWPALTAHTGTAGTAETRRVVVDTDGNLMVNIAAGESINIGTLSLGTIDMLKAGTVSMLKAGTIDKLAGGTIDMLKGGTINSGTFTMGIGTLNAGTINAATITAGTLTNVEEDYAIMVDESTSGTTYYGFALPINGGSPDQAVWKILRKAYDATSSIYRYAGSSKAFTNVWNNRASLNY